MTGMPYFTAFLNYLIIDEIRLGRRIDKLQKNMDELNEFYRISLLEKGNLQLLEQRVHSLENLVYRGENHSLVKNTAKSI